MWLPDFEELTTLEEKYGDSFHLFDIDAFVRNFLEFRDEFRSFYAPTEVAYSYKTNYAPVLCRKVDELGGYAEVVSGMEYEIALKSGISPHRIIFNGPYRTESDMTRAVAEGAILNIEAPYQIDLLARIMKGSDPGKEVSVGVRANFEVEKISRFGFAAKTGEFAEAFRRLEGISGVRIKGVHCHYSTGIRSPENYAKISRRMIELADECFGEKNPEFIDIGGGYFSKMSEELRSQFDGDTYSYADYADAIGREFADAYGTNGGPTLILEPGVALTADIGTFAAKVLDIRDIPGETFMLVSGSIHNIKPTLNRLNLPVHLVRSNTSDRTTVSGSIVGYTCMEHDFLFRGFEGEVAAGDWVVFENTGAYTNVMKQPFIRPAPPILARDKEKVSVVKRKETTEDLMATYDFGS